MFVPLAYTPVSATFVPMRRSSNTFVGTVATAAAPLTPPAVPVVVPIVAAAVVVSEPTSPGPLELEIERLTVEHAREIASLKAEIRRERAEEQMVTGALSRAIDALEVLHTRLLTDFRSQAADVVVAAAVHIAGQGLRVQPELLDALLSEAISSLGMNDLVLRVSPEDEPRIRAAFELRHDRRAQERPDRREGPDGEPNADRRVNTAPYPGEERRSAEDRRGQTRPRRATPAPRITIVADETVSAGCIVQGPTGSIDASLATAAAALEACSAQWKAL